MRQVALIFLAVVICALSVSELALGITCSSALRLLPREQRLSVLPTSFGNPDRAAILATIHEPGRVVHRDIPLAPNLEGRLFVINKGPSPGMAGRDSLMVFNLATGRMEAEIAWPEQGPHELTFSPDRTRLAVPNYGRMAQGSPISTGDGHSLTIVDTDTYEPRTISLAPYNRTHGVEWLDDRRIAVTADGKNGNLERGFVLIVDTVTGRIEHEIPTGQPGTHLVRRSANGSRLYVTNIQGGAFTVLDAQNGTWLRTLSTGPGTEGFDIRPGGRAGAEELWVGAQDDDAIHVIRADSNADQYEITQTIRAPGRPIRVRFTPDGRNAVVAFRGSNELAVYDVATRTELRRIPLEVPAIVEGLPVHGRTSVPMMIEIHPDGRTAWVGNSHSGLVSVIDITLGTVIGYFRAGDKPDPIGFLPPPAAR